MTVATDKKIIVAICTYNRADRLPALVDALRRQDCPIQCEILAVDNNSKDDTQNVLEGLAAKKGIPLRYVKEEQQGIAYARNRAIEEALGSTFLAFIDDDEMPEPGWLETAVDALEVEGADCVGGEIRIGLAIEKCPGWLGEELRGFLGEVRQAPDPFWIVDRSSPVWSGNIAYNIKVFARGLRFDERYNRSGFGIGGGEDAVMFNTLLEQGARIRYRPDMAVEHIVEDWKLKRSYFLKLHHMAGWKQGRWDESRYRREILAVPPFMLVQAMRHMARTFGLIVQGKHGVMRQAMNAAHALGMIQGRVTRWRAGN